MKIGKQLLRNSTFFLIGSLLNKAIPFLMLPILTRYLKADEYGLVSTFSACFGIVLALTSISVPSAISINFFKISKNDHKSYIFNSILIVSFTSIIFNIFIFLIGNYISEISKVPQKWLYYLSIYAYTHIISEVFLSLLRVQKRAILFSIFEIVRTSLNFSLSLYLILNMNIPWEGRLYGIVYSSLIFSIISLVYLYLKNHVSLKINKEQIKDIFLYGLPLIPHVISGWIITASDRFFINTYSNLRDTGLYSVGYQISLILGVVVIAFNNAWHPYLFDRLKNVDSYLKIKIVKFTYLYFIVVLSLSFILSVVSPYILTIFTTAEYSTSAEYIWWIAPSYAFNGMYFMVSGYLFYLKKTKYISLCTASGAIINILLNYFLIKENGAIGAAQATLLSYIIIFFLSWYFSAKNYSMPWFRLKING